MPWLDSVSRMAWEFSWAPGICTRKELLPCCWTVAAEAPDALTRLVMTCCAWLIWSLVMAEPSLVDALRLTETPPWMSRPMVDLVLRGIQQEHRRDEGREDDDEGDDAALLAPAARLGGRAVRGLVGASARAALDACKALLAHRLLLGLGAGCGLGLLLGTPTLLLHFLLAARLELFSLAALLLEVLGIAFQGFLASTLVGGLLARLRCHLLVAFGVALLPCPVLFPLLGGFLALFREFRVHLLGLGATALLTGR